MQLMQIREILRGKSSLGLIEAARSIEERNENSLKMMEAAQVKMMMVMMVMEDAQVMMVIVMETGQLCPCVRHTILYFIVYIIIYLRFL